MENKDRIQDLWVVVPSFNEAGVLPDVLHPLCSRYSHVIVVDDGSTDATPEVARRFPIHFLRHAVNLGQGAALQTGLAYALSRGAGIIVTFDADGQMDPADIEVLCGPVITGAADVALGTRFQGKLPQGLPWMRRFLLKLVLIGTKLSTGLPLTDTNNGFRAFSRTAAGKIHIENNRMAHASEILSQIVRRGLKIVEVPVTIRYTPYSLRKGQRTMDFVNIVWEIIFKK